MPQAADARPPLPFAVGECLPLPTAAAIRKAIRDTAAGRGVVWVTSRSPVDYPSAISFMEERVAAIRAGAAPETIWLLEHPSLYTAGTSARPAELLQPDRFPVYVTGRGGRYTYHGPGQRIAYVMLDVKRRGGDVRAFVFAIESWLIASLAMLGVNGERRSGRVGIWVLRADGSEAKVAAIGIRLRRWVSFHGIALNIDPDLSHFNGIVPCGLGQYGVTSLAALGVRATAAEVDKALHESFKQVFARI